MPHPKYLDGLARLASLPDDYDNNPPFGAKLKTIMALRLAQLLRQKTGTNCKKYYDPDVTIDYLVGQNPNGICQLTGVELDYKFGSRKFTPEVSPSLDCIDNHFGYLTGNVWQISMLANKIKAELSVDKTVYLCKKAILASRDRVDFIPLQLSSTYNKRTYEVSGTPRRRRLKCSVCGGCNSKRYDLLGVLFPCCYVCRQIYRATFDGFIHYYSWVKKLPEEFLVDLWNQQQGRCAIWNNPLDYTTNMKMGPSGQSSGFRIDCVSDFHRPTLDQIVPRGGYVPDNVRWTSRWANYGRSSFNTTMYKKTVYLIANRDEVQINEDTFRLPDDYQYQYGTIPQSENVIDRDLLIRLIRVFSQYRKMCGKHLGHYLVRYLHNRLSNKSSQNSSGPFAAYYVKKAIAKFDEVLPYLLTQERFHD
ncbi:MAG: hypothetical protein ACXABY_22635 [Candidatus Thorarchaeota archaeon]|jgi:hypothetical protein